MTRQTILFAVLAIIVVGAGAYYFTQYSFPQEPVVDQENVAPRTTGTTINPKQVQVNTAANQQVGTKDEFATWQEYSSTENGFSFKYPSDWKVVSLEKGRGADTIIVSVAPKDFKPSYCFPGCDSPRALGYFYVHPFTQPTEEYKQQRVALGLDTGWKNSNPDIFTLSNRGIITADQKIEIGMIAIDGESENKLIVEKILSTFTYKK